MPLCELVRQRFSVALRSRGDDYFRSNRVAIERHTARGVEASVTGQGDDYEVDVDWSEAKSKRLIRGHCTCPYFQDHAVCKHVWAVIREADQHGLTRALGNLGQLSFVEVDIDEDGDEEAIDDLDVEIMPRGWRQSELIKASERDKLSKLLESYVRDTRRMPAGARGAKKKPTAKKETRAQLEHKRVVEARSLLERLGGSVGRSEPWSETPSGELAYVIDSQASFESDQLVVLLMRRPRKMDGQLGKSRPFHCSVDELPRLVSREDARCLDFLRAFGRPGWYEGHHTYTVARAYALEDAGIMETIPMLAATNRLYWVLDPSLPYETDGRRLAWDDGPPWRLTLDIADEPKAKRWKITGRLTRGDESATLDLPICLRGEGLVMFPDRLARLDALDEFAWVEQLVKKQCIEVPYAAESELMDCLTAGSRAIDVRFPENLRWSEIASPPKGRLRVQAERRQGYARLLGEASFVYEGQTVRAGERRARIADHENKRLIVTDQEAETRLRAELMASGARPLDGVPSARFGDASAADVEIPSRQLPRVVEGLVDRGWEVEAEGNTLRRASQFQLNVASGVDWFDVSCHVSFDGHAAPLPDILKAIRKGERYVPLGDGSHGLLPAEWLKRLEALSNLGEATAEGDALRFRPSQAMLLDALLAEREEVGFDPPFAEWREKLRSLRGVRPCDAPVSFVGSLRDYQRQGLGWLNFLREFHLGGCLADDMGLGKTIQVLAQLEAARESRQAAGEPRAASLVIVPRSLVRNWVEEAARFTPKLSVLDYTGLGRAPRFEELSSHDVVITTYGTLRRDVAKLKDVEFEYVILDEAQAIKNASSQSAKACRLLNGRHRLAMTGTPVENHVGELWSLFEFLNPGMLGRVQGFDNLARERDTGGVVNVLGRALAPFILRRTKGQVLAELPAKTEQTIVCDLEPAERKEYDSLRAYYRDSLTKKIASVGLARSKMHVLESLLRLRQAACHLGLIDPKKASLPSAKIDTLLERIGEIVDEGHKALVFSQFTSLLAILRKRLDAGGVTYEYLDGKTRDRQARVDRFQTDAACHLFLISLKAGGTGLNLTAADYVFILDPWWNPAVEAQAIDRAHRIGQTRPVMAYRLIARDTVEEKIIELQKSKRELADAIVSADESLLRRLSVEDLKLLLA